MGVVVVEVQVINYMEGSQVPFGLELYVDKARQGLQGGSHNGLGTVYPNRGV